MFRNLKAKIKAARKNNDLEFFALDLAMLVLVSLNLLLIAVEWLYLIEAVNEFLATQFPEVYQWYSTWVHKNFLEIDLVFVVLFLSELLFRWGVAIWRNTYHKWFFYPFVHWYDALGCIPLSSFRLLRLLRVFGMVYRLQRMGIINLRDTYLFNLLHRYYSIFVEEITDKVVINILEGVKKEVLGGSSVSKRIMGEVVTPRKHVIVNWLGGKIGSATAQTYEQHRQAIKEYVDGLIKVSIDENREMRRLELVPVFGSIVTGMIEKAVSDIVFNVINNAANDIARNKNELVTEIADLIFETLLITSNDPRVNELAIGIFVDTIDILKDKVGEKQWLLDEIEKNQEQIRKEVETEMAMREAIKRQKSPIKPLDKP